MSRLKAVASALVIPVALAGVLSQGTGDAEAQIILPTDRKVYSTKFLCGEFQPIGFCTPGGNPCQTDADCITGGVCESREGPVKPGNYQTAINIVNPTRKPILFVKKAVLLWDSANPPPPGQFEMPQPPVVPPPPQPLPSVLLEENWGVEIDCPDIRQVLLGQPAISPPAPFIKGFVEIEIFGPDEQLDVVAAYTSHGFTGHNVCSLPGTPADGTPCEPVAADPCIVAGGVCLPGPISEEGFSIDVQEIAATLEAGAGSAFQRRVQAAKFLCGEFQPIDLDGDGIPEEGPVKPGNYQTAINVVNPTRKPITFVKKAVLLYDSRQPPTGFEVPQPPGPLASAHLPPNWGLEIDCPDIRDFLLAPLASPPPVFIKGYVVIETFVEDEQLDVVAAYTSHGFTGLFANRCSLPGSPLDGLPCDPDDITDPCLVGGGLCLEEVVGIVPEGFSIDVEDVEEKDAPF